MSQHQKHLSAYLKSKRSGSTSSGTATDRKTFTGVKTSSTQKGKSHPSADLKLKRGLDLTRVPEEVLLKIFKYLSPSELLVCAQVCHKWSAVSQDSCLWEPLLPYLPKRVRDTITFKEAKEESFDWKREIIKRCIQARNEEMLRKRGVSPYTGLQKDVFHPLRYTDIRWKLCVTDTSGKENWQSSDCSTLFQSSLCVRWYSLHVPPLSKLKTLRVFAFVPIFFSRSWKPHYDSATTRSLILQFDFRSRGSQLVFSQATAVSGAGMITAHVICSSTLAACWSASWKDGGELAFVTLCLHQHNLSKKVVLGSHCRTFIPSAHVPVPDDVDPKYGLHGYSATIELRNHKTTFWGRQYRELYQQYLADSYVSLGGGGHEHGSFTRKLSLPWKTELFKNVLPDMCFLDLTVLHDRKPFWCFSSPVKILINKVLDGDFTSDGEKQFIEYSDEHGTLRMDFLWIKTSRTQPNQVFSANQRKPVPQPNGLVSCELLSTDKYNESEKFEGSEAFHHYSIMIVLALALRSNSRRTSPQKNMLSVNSREETFAKELDTTTLSGETNKLTREVKRLASKVALLQSQLMTERNRHVMKIGSS